MARVFFSYSHDDEVYRDQLEKHLAMLRHQGLIESWHDRRIAAGSNIGNTIDDQLDSADIILLLVSASFLSSDYCYSIEMRRAMERHAQGDVTVVPVIVRPCDWHSAPFGTLLAVPRDGKAITQWPNYDEAYADVAQRIRELVQLKSGMRHDESPRATPASSVPLAVSLPRSSNLRLRKEFNDRDRQAFVLDALEYAARFFEGSLQELHTRHPEVEHSFRRVDANCFTATVFRGGNKVSECSVRLGGFGRSDLGIAYSHDASERRNSFNEMLSVETDDQGIFFKTLGMTMRHARDSKLSPEGAAEFLWSLLIEPLQ